MTAPSGSKIDFIGIAAARCGSTWISECLREHPQIDFPKRSSLLPRPLDATTVKSEKELAFFAVGELQDGMLRPAGNSQRGLEWYLDRFPPAAPGRLRGEFTPDYHMYSGAAEAIHRTFPDARLIATLRYPPDALHSLSRLLVKHERYSGVPFDEAVAKGLFRERGFYSRTLAPFFKLFPREQIHVILYDDIERDPASVVRGLYRFLGVDEDFVPPALHLRINAVRKSKPGLMHEAATRTLATLRHVGLDRLADALEKSPDLYRIYFRLNTADTRAPDIKPETMDRLRAMYRDDIIALGRLIGRDMRAWLER